MRVALLTNSKLSVPAIDFLGAERLLASVGLPWREDKTEDADHIQYTAAQHQVPVAIFSKNDLAAALTEWIAGCKADVVLVFTFPFKIPVEVLNLPPKGFINFHFGVLPQYRGADAIFWQIRKGEKEGGISVHQMNGQFDKGPLYMVHKVPIVAIDTYGSHLLNLSMAAIQVVQNLLNALHTGEARAVEQDETKAAYHHRPVLQDLVIDWNKPAADIVALVNAANPWNKGAVAYINQYPIKIVAVSQVDIADPGSVNEKPGTIIIPSARNACFVCCGSGEMLTLDIIYCNDSFITGQRFASLGISTGVQFDKVPAVGAA